MIVNQTVKVRLRTDNKEWYENKGYVYQNGAYIDVPIKDALPRTTLKCVCDNCGKEYDRKVKALFGDEYLTQYCDGCLPVIKKKVDQDNREYYLAHNGTKVCSICQRKLPADKDHYFKKCDTLDGFARHCKECCGHSFTFELSTKDGYKVCKKCNRELPHTILFFPSDNTLQSGLRNICRECTPKCSGFLEEGYDSKVPWTEEELTLLKANYPHYQNSELIELFFPQRTIRSVETMAHQHQCNGKTEEVKARTREQVAKKLSEIMTGREFSEEAITKLQHSLREYYKTHHGSRLGCKASEESRRKMSIAKKASGQWQGDTNPRHINPLMREQNGRWRGGITPLMKELRSELKEWQKRSMEICNYKSVLTMGEFDNVHHLIPFRDIVNAVIQCCGLDIRPSPQDYTDDEFLLLRECVIEAHEKSLCGVCIEEPLHALFHKEFGYWNNTAEQFVLYVNKLLDGDYNDFLYDNSIELNVNIDALEKILHTKIKE